MYVGLGPLSSPSHVESDRAGCPQAARAATTRQLTSAADAGPLGRRGRSHRVAWLSIGYLAFPKTSQIVRGLS